jgi:taurine--2-oxoglutarate transaminase
VTNIQILGHGRLIEQSQARGDHFLGRLEALQKAHPPVGEVPGIGLFAAPELVADPHTSAPLGPFNHRSPAMEAFRARLLELGVFAYLHWNVVLVVPPLKITEQELAAGLDALGQALTITDAACRINAAGNGG